MAFSLPLNPTWANQRWKVKIRDRERLEPPHVSILRGTKTWRLNLRTGRFLDAEPDPSEVPAEFVAFIMEHWLELRAKWDEMYPENPVESDDERGS